MWTRWLPVSSVPEYYTVTYYFYNKQLDFDRIPKYRADYLMDMARSSQKFVVEHEGRKYVVHPDHIMLACRSVYQPF